MFCCLKRDKIERWIQIFPFLELLWRSEEDKANQISHGCLLKQFSALKLQCSGSTTDIQHTLGGYVRMDLYMLRFIAYTAIDCICKEAI